MGSRRSAKIAYLAGIIDGEGTVTIKRARIKDGYESIVYSCHVRIANKNWELMEFIHKEFGGTFQKPGGKILRIDWQGNRGKEILELVKPYLIVKKELANIVLEFERMRQAEAEKGRKPYSNNYHQEAPRLHIQMKEATKAQYKGW